MDDTSDFEDDNVAPDNTFQAKDALPEDILNVLLATDIHLGYGEKDSIRGEDSFTAFEEILKLGKDNKVDMILLGGDLFHDSKPSMMCIHKCMSLIRKYCLGNDPVSVQFLSDPRLNFSHCNVDVVNYEDPNINISIPIFSIHGNHDDPSGFGSTCTLDILSTSGLVNYFGKQEDLSHIDISPILLSKGKSQLALYGLSHVKDARLNRLFKEKKVQMSRPSDSGEWFNLLVLHQNRSNHDNTAKGYIPEEMLPRFLDLVFWGHEHECRVEEEFNATQEFYVTQPGSPVATSLSAGEAVPKKVAILRVHGKQFKLDYLPLRTVRPFVFDTLALSDCLLPTAGARPCDNVQQYIGDYLESMFAKAKQLRTGHRAQPPLPLIRLRVLYSDESQMFNHIRFGQQFAARVANPEDMFLQSREGAKAKGGKDGQPVDRDALEAALQATEAQSLLDSRVEQVVLRYFANTDVERQLRVLSVPGLLEGVTQFVDKDDKDAVIDIIRSQKKKTARYLVEHNVNESNINRLLDEFNAARNPKLEAEEAKEELTGRDTTFRRPAEDSVSDDEITVIGSDDEEVGVAPAAKGRGRGRGRANRAPRARGRAAPTTRGRQAKQVSVADVFASGNGNGSRYGDVTRKPSTQRKGMTYSDSDSD